MAHALVRTVTRGNWGQYTNWWDQESAGLIRVLSPVSGPRFRQLIVSELPDFESCWNYDIECNVVVETLNALSRHIQHQIDSYVLCEVHCTA